MFHNYVYHATARPTLRNKSLLGTYRLKDWVLEAKIVYSKKDDTYLVKISDLGNDRKFFPQPRAVFKITNPNTKKGYYELRPFGKINCDGFRALYDPDGPHSDEPLILNPYGHEGIYLGSSKLIRSH